MSDGNRRNELLAIARRSRFKWVNDASDGVLLNKSQRDSTQRTADQSIKIPAAECIQQVLDFFAQLIDDGETVDLHSLIGLSSSGYESESDEESSADIDLIPQYDQNAPNYAIFISKLKHPKATEIIKSFQQFVAKYETRSREARDNALDIEISSSDQVVERTDLIWGFYDHILESMRENPLWACETEIQWEKTKLSCEKFLFIKLHRLLFATDAEDLLQDQRIHSRLESLGFLTPEHLDIKSLYGTNGESIVALPSKILLELEHARCPGDKLKCLRKCSLAIAQALKSARTDGSLPGADEFLPMMILVVKESNPAYLHSTIKYLQRYTHPSKLVSEAGYLMTHFVSAVHFLENVDANALTISPEEFESSMWRCKEAAKRSTEELIARSPKGGSRRFAGPSIPQETQGCNGPNSISNTTSRRKRIQKSRRGKVQYETVEDLRAKYFGSKTVDNEGDLEGKMHSAGVDCDDSSVDVGVGRAAALGGMAWVATGGSIAAKDKKVTSNGGPTALVAIESSLGGQTGGQRGSKSDPDKYDIILEELMAIEEDDIAQRTEDDEEDAGQRVAVISIVDTWRAERKGSRSYDRIAGVSGGVGGGNNSVLSTGKTEIAGASHTRGPLTARERVPTISHKAAARIAKVLDVTTSEVSSVGAFSGSSADRITVGDIPQLLYEYKLMLKALSASIE